MNIPFNYVTREQDPGISYRSSAVQDGLMVLSFLSF